LKLRRICSHFEYSELSDEDQDSVAVSPNLMNSLDAARLIEWLHQINEPYRSAMTLFYAEDFSYKEMAEILGVPIGTAQSRVSRGVGRLQRLIFRESDMGQRRPLPGPGAAERSSGIGPGLCTASKLTTYEKQDATIAQQDREGESIHDYVCKVRL
jgi:hypothetical protein